MSSSIAATSSFGDANATEATLSQPLTSWTRRTLTDLKRLRTDLVEARRDGIAFDDEEAQEG